MIASITIVRYRKRLIIFGLLSMIIFRLPLTFNKRCKFYKLMGSGKNGSFDKSPDFQQWAIVSTSNLRFKEVQIKHYESTILINKLYGSFIRNWINFFKCETITYLLDPIEGHGLWNGKKVFGELPTKTEYEGQIAVLTRANIRFNKMGEFWKHVDAVADKMATANGFIKSYGIGEIPWKKQATFSIWESKAAMKDFAYGMKEHQEVIQKTRKHNWYSEDMFTRFRIIGCIGALNKSNPIKDKLKLHG